MWNHGEPAPYDNFEERKLCGTFGNLVPGFGRLPPNNPEALLEEPQAFQAVRGKVENSPPSQLHETHYSL